MELRQQLDGGSVIPRHRHAQPYAAVVLAGGYQEAGDGGRWQAYPGDVLVHLPWTSHMDRLSSRRTMVLNLPLPGTIIDMSPHHRVEDPDALVRVAERNMVEAVGLLLEQLLPGGDSEREPVDELATQLASGSAPSINAWSQHAGVRRETVFRWFQAAYGVSPTQYRVEARARAAWQEAAHGTRTFSEIAADTGFADQAHMSRAVRALTGFSPRQWRMQHSFKIPET